MQNQLMMISELSLFSSFSLVLSIIIDIPSVKLCKLLRCLLQLVLPISVFIIQKGSQFFNTVYNVSFAHIMWYPINPSRDTLRVKISTIDKECRFPLFDQIQDSILKFQFKISG